MTGILDTLKRERYIKYLKSYLFEYPILFQHKAIIISLQYIYVPKSCMNLMIQKSFVLNYSKLHLSYLPAAFEMCF
jgi:hypothetical protein